MSEEDKVLDIRLRLKGKVKRKFLDIKDVLGLTNNTEVCRLIIKRANVKKFAEAT